MPITSGEIVRRWTRQDLIDYEGLHLPDDTIIPFRFGCEGARAHVELLPPIAVSDLPRDLLDYVDGGDILCEDRTEEFFVCGGERHSHGSGGFVALSLASSPSTLLWLAVLDCSNPFVAVKVLGDQIEATTSLETTWRFGIAPPYAIAVPDEDP
jgi:hypothetical protein